MTPARPAPCIYEYALGSARETRGWYYKGREAFDPKVVKHRLSICGELIPLLLTMIRNERLKTNRISD